MAGDDDREGITLAPVQSYLAGLTEDGAVFVILRCGPLDEAGTAGPRQEGPKAVRFELPRAAAEKFATAIAEIATAPHTPGRLN